MNKNTNENKNMKGFFTFYKIHKISEFLLYYSGRRLYQYNEDDFRIQFKIIMDTHKHRSQENLSIKKASL